MIRSSKLWACQKRVQFDGYIRDHTLEGLETNHVRHRLVYLRARAMLNSVIHTSQVLEGAEIPGTIAIKIRFCASASTVQKVCYTTLYIIAIYLNIRSNISCLRIEHYNQMLILQYSQSRVVCGILANL